MTGHLCLLPGRNPPPPEVSVESARLTPSGGGGLAALIRLYMGGRSAQARIVTIRATSAFWSFETNLTRRAGQDSSLQLLLIPAQAAFRWPAKQFMSHFLRQETGIETSAQVRQRTILRTPLTIASHHRHYRHHLYSYCHPCRARLSAGYRDGLLKISRAD